MNVSVLYFFLHAAQSHAWIVSLSLFLSNWGIYLLPAVVLGYILFFEKTPWKKIGYVTIVMLVVVLLTDFFLKGLFSELRPYITLGYVPLSIVKGFSFPSVHATFAGALAAATYLSISKHHIFTLFVLVVCFLIGLSRITLGVHYPSDVLVGFVWGAVASCIGYWLVYRHA